MLICLCHWGGEIFFPRQPSDYWGGEMILSPPHIDYWGGKIKLCHKCNAIKLAMNTNSQNHKHAETVLHYYIYNYIIQSIRDLTFASVSSSEDDIRNVSINLST